MSRSIARPTKAREKLIDRLAAYGADAVEVLVPLLRTEDDRAVLAKEVLFKITGFRGTPGVLLPALPSFDSAANRDCDPFFDPVTTFYLEELNSGDEARRARALQVLREIKIIKVYAVLKDTRFLDDARKEKWKVTPTDLQWAVQYFSFHEQLVDVPAPAGVVENIAAILRAPDKASLSAPGKNLLARFVPALIRVLENRVAFRNANWDFEKVWLPRIRDQIKQRGIAISDEELRTLLPTNDPKIPVERRLDKAMIQFDNDAAALAAIKLLGEIGPDAAEAVEAIKKNRDLNDFGLFGGPSEKVVEKALDRIGKRP